jgi:hypothetical protein
VGTKIIYLSKPTLLYIMTLTIYVPGESEHKLRSVFLYLNLEQIYQKQHGICTFYLIETDHSFFSRGIFISKSY